MRAEAELAAQKQALQNLHQEKMVEVGEYVKSYMYLSLFILFVIYSTVCDFNRECCNCVFVYLNVFPHFNYVCVHPAVLLLHRSSRGRRCVRWVSMKTNDVDTENMLHVHPVYTALIRIFDLPNHYYSINNITYPLIHTELDEEVGFN